MSFPFLFVAALFTLNPISLSVFPRWSMPPATFRAMVVVPKHADNRALCLSYRALGEVEPIRRSCHEMAGDKEPRVRTMYWDIRSSGEYEAVAVLTRWEDGKERVYAVLQPFQVIGARD